MNNASKTAVILFNLGGPDSREAIKPFLRNFFTDPNIIRLPWIFRRLIAELIAIKRSKREAGDSYALLGNRSPLLENSQAQADALEAALNDGDDLFKCFVCMRYWHPMAPEVAKAVKDWNPDRIVLLPLYPQYSTTTTRSSFQQWFIAADKVGLDCPTASVCCYPQDSGFINASASIVRTAYETAVQEIAGRDLPPPRLLFSAHGLPESIVHDGDPYQWQCDASAASIAEASQIRDLDWEVCYQSQVGPKKWIGPSTEQALEKAAADGVPVLVLPHAFVNEHVETLVEIEIEYRELAESLGIPYFARVPTVSENPVFIDGLAQLVRANTGRTGLFSNLGDPVCPHNYRRCCHRDPQTGFLRRG